MPGLRRARHSAPERREMVADAARAQFARRGLYGATGDEIAAAAGITHPYLLRLFGSKKELFLVVAERFLDQLDEAVRTAEDESLSAAVALIDHTLDQNSGRLFLLQLFAAAGEPDVRALVQERLRVLYRALARRGSAEEVRAVFERQLLSAAGDAAGLPELARRQRWARALLP